MLHCFSGSVEMLREVLDLGLYVGLGGSVTFKNARVPVEVAREVPLDRLLTETDCPYLAPVPFRGKRCDSTMIAYTAAKIAEVRGITAAEVLEAGRRNALSLIHIYVDVFMIAPKGPGHTVRSEFVEGKGVPAPVSYIHLS